MITQSDQSSDRLLDRFFLDFGSQDGAKIHPKSIIIQSDTDLETNQKNITCWRATRSTFEGFWLPTWGPREGTQVYFFDHVSLLVPSWSQPKLFELLRSWKHTTS